MTSTQHRHVTPAWWNDVEMECGGCRRIGAGERTTTYYQRRKCGCAWHAALDRDRLRKRIKMEDRRGQTTSVDTANTHEEKNLSRRAGLARAFQGEWQRDWGWSLGAWLGWAVLASEPWSVGCELALALWRQNLKIRTLVLCIPGVGFARCGREAWFLGRAPSSCRTSSFGGSSREWRAADTAKYIWRGILGLALSDGNI